MNRLLQTIGQSLSHGLKPRLLKDPASIEIGIMNSSTEKTVYDLLMKDFFAREPLCNSLFLRSAKETEEVCSKFLEYGIASKLSSVAVDKKAGRAAGVIIAYIEKPGMESPLSVAGPSSKFVYISEILDQVTVDMYAYFGTDQLLCLMIASVLEEYAGLKIGQKLTSKCLEAGIKWNSRLAHSKPFRSLSNQFRSKF